MPTSLTIKEAAEHFHISESTVRRRIKDGSLTAFKQPTTQGYEWRVRIPDIGEQLPMQRDEQVVTNDDYLPTNGEQVFTVDREVITTPAQEVITADQPVHTASELVGLVRELHTENLQLAGRITWLEMQLQQATEQIRLLTDQQAAKDEPEPAAAPAEEPPQKRLPWYKRWFAEI